MIDGINPNILHNAYFRGGGSHTGSANFPINQRGQSSYSSSGYTVDRWTMSSNASLSFTSGPADAIRLSKATAGEVVDLSQKLENIIKGVLTFSALVRVDLKASGQTDAGYLHIAMKDAYDNDLSDTSGSDPDPTFIYTSSINDVILVESHYKGDGNSVSSVNFHLDNAVPVNGYVDILACKLELGNKQTLAHRSGGAWVLNAPPPDHTIELMKCQRYFQVYTSAHTAATATTDWRPVMRAEPDVEHQISGPYYYSADL